MSGEEERRKKAEAIVNSTEMLMGDISQTDEDELDELYQEFGQGRDPAVAVRELALKAARSHRLANRFVPLHVQSALDATGQKDLASIKPSVLKTIVDQVLKPTFSAVQSSAPAYRGKKDLTAKDKDIVDELTGELEQPWDESNSDERH